MIDVQLGVCFIIIPALMPKIKCNGLNIKRCLCCYRLLDAKPEHGNQFNFRTVVRHFSLLIENVVNDFACTDQGWITAFAAINFEMCVSCGQGSGSY